MRKYGESKTTRIMMATVPHVTSGLGLRKFQAVGFLLTRVYQRLPKQFEGSVRVCKNENKAGVHKPLSPNYILYGGARRRRSDACNFEVVSTFLGAFVHPWNKMSFEVDSID